MRDVLQLKGYSNSIPSCTDCNLFFQYSPFRVVFLKAEKKGIGLYFKGVGNK